MANVFIASAIIILITMSCIWLLSVFLKNMSIVDGFWGIGFIAIAYHFIYHSNDILPRQFLIAFLITLWGLRLAVHIFYRNHEKGEDPRYAAWRKDWGVRTWWMSYYRVFLLQGALIFVINLPVLMILLHADDYLNNLDKIGISIWLIGWLFESIGDYQLVKFKQNPLNNGKVMNSGLWKYTRHPNYFGETCIWWGIFIISISSGNWYISILSPILITFLLLKVSGVTLLEKRYDGNEKYADYKRMTSAFFPLPPKK